MKKPLLTVCIIALSCFAGCTALSIGGCATILGVAVFQSANQPEYANAETLTQTYGDDFENIHTALSQEVSLKFEDQKVPLHEDVLAIITEVNGRDVDIYKQLTDAELGSYSISFNAGTGTLRTSTHSHECLIYQMEVNQHDYYICLRDTFKKEIQE
ncbi:hypothetical protein ACFSW8_17615 [Rubritalea tangerina]|uniref:Lipoprotein n=2 Tax=Rubritalea tangerina TaxID=430798 RepID=A0ABW4ZFV7_9BACT